MNIFSIEFALLFLVFLFLYWKIKKLIVQNFLILSFNYGLILMIGNFYIALVLFCYTLLIYCCSILIARSKTILILLICIALAILNLCFFKYFASIKDFYQTLFAFLGFSKTHINILMPIGISFYTFSSITYLKWIYDGRKHPSNPHLQSFESLAAYLSFFPTFISGPIMRAEFFFEQFNRPRYWDYRHANGIFVLLLFGIIKKVLLANYAGIYASEILKDPNSFNPIELLLGIYGYSIQIYCDFSGYVNLVCAFALMMGFMLPANFNMPYSAKNLKDFWNRWHISLSTFIRDFIYIPLGGNKKGFFLAQIFVMISFILSGIWHGNTINFLIWGLLHGFGIVILNILSHYHIHFQKIPMLSKTITFHFVTFCWIFFYYENFEDSMLFLHAFHNPIEIKQQEVILLIIGCFCFLIYQFCAGLQNFCIALLYRIPNLLKPFLFAIFLTIIFSIMPNGIPNFIYANF